ncbi:MAG TPA: hypothetical protein PLN21_09455 [Gemmatales bacterium]|nr:hypothetical protein [Gemmatales bacterium]
MPVTITGRPIVSGEKDRTILFTNIGLDWAGAGYTLKLRVTNSDGDPPTDYDLDAVVGEAEQAELTSTEDVFPDAGYYTLKLIAFSGADERVLAENLLIEVKP